MKTKYSLLLTSLVIIGGIYILGGFSYITGLATVGANLTVTTTCVLTLNDTNITFGTVSPTAISGERLVKFTNDGNALLNATINGTDWDGPGAVIMDVNQTKYANSTGTYASKTSVTFTATQFIYNLGISSPVTEYFQVQVPVGQAAGFYNQTLFAFETC